ncbi:MAG TPA: hypothetical protein VKZ85_11200 [Woeseiaceae bacterium]|nr:hypothetical protein [Woeseiaceae bacterium]
MADYELFRAVYTAEQQENAATAFFKHQRLLNVDGSGLIAVIVLWVRLATRVGALAVSTGSSFLPYIFLPAFLTSIITSPSKRCWTPSSGEGSIFSS